MNWLSRILSGRKSPGGVAAMAIPAERWESLRPSDQFVVSYPRSGNTWLRYLLREVIVLQHPELPAPADLEALLPTVHVAAPDDPAQEAFGLRTRLLKSHNIADLSGRRMVYIFREPADALVSFYHHRRRKLARKGVELEETLDGFCQRRVPVWCEHVRLGLEQHGAFPGDTLLLAYEDLHARTQAALRGVVDFLGLPASDAQLAEAIERNRFERLRSKEEQKAAPPASSAPGEFFFRKGRVGGGGEELCAESVRLLERAARPLYRRAAEAANRPH